MLSYLSVRVSGSIAGHFLINELVLDFALRCLTNFDQKSNKVSGLIMAFCCHHRCLWKDYVGKQFLLVSVAHSGVTRQSHICERIMYDHTLHVTVQNLSIV